MSKVKVIPEQINAIISSSKIEDIKMGEKTTVVACTLENGFEIVESSSCVDPENYDHEIGKEICIERIRNKIWMLEGYRLQCDVYASKQCDDFASKQCDDFASND